MEIVIIKQCNSQLTGGAADIMRNFLFEWLKGATEQDDKAWKRFWNAVNKAKEGEYFSVKVVRRRSTPFHRLHMKIETLIFESQEKFVDRKVFRAWAKIGSNFVDYVPNRDGEMVAVPKTTNFDDCTEEEMRQFHHDFMTFIRTAYALDVLWPSQTVFQASQGLEMLLKDFE